MATTQDVVKRMSIETVVKATQAFQARVATAAASAGTLGSVLSTLGPIGVGVAATIGGAVIAFEAASTAAHHLADKAVEIKKFADTTGLTTTQVQALRLEAGR